MGTAVALPTHGITALRALRITEAEIDNLGVAGYGSPHRAQDGQRCGLGGAPATPGLHGLLLENALAAGVELGPGAGVGTVDCGELAGRAALVG